MIIHQLVQMDANCSILCGNSFTCASRNIVNLVFDASFRVSGGYKCSDSCSVALLLIYWLEGFFCWGPQFLW